MSGPPALVPTSPWFGDGSDGELAITADYPIEVQEDIGHIFKQYTSLHIQSGGTLRPSARCAGMVILVQGDCTIDAGGSINMDKMAPRRSDDTEAEILTTGPSAPWLQKISGLVGGAGGKGGKSSGGSESSSGKETGTGGQGGRGHSFGGGYGGGGAGAYSSTNISGGVTDGGTSNPRPLASIPWPFAGTTGAGENGAGGGAGGGAIGGAAPGGGGAAKSHALVGNAGEPGSAYGGGMLMLVVGGIVTIDGTITANGGRGGDGGAASWHQESGGGGGGGGGLIVIYYKNANVLQGSIGAAGGSGGSGSYQNGTNGSTGTTRISQVDDELNEI